MISNLGFSSETNLNGVSVMDVIDFASYQDRPSIFVRWYRGEEQSSVDRNTHLR